MSSSPSWRFLVAVQNLSLLLIHVLPLTRAAELLTGSALFNNQTRVKQILVLNMDRRPERMASVTKELTNANLSFMRFPAVDGHFIQSKQLDKLSINNETKFNFQRWITQPHPVADYGVVGCWQSHLQAYFWIRDQVEKHGEPDQPVLVLEDDVYLRPNATELINQAGSYLPNNWDVFFVGYKNDYCFYYISEHLCRGSMILDTHAYIVRNASVAAKLIHYSNVDSVQTADIYWIPLFADILKIFLTRPVEVIRQNKEKFSTDIHVEDPTPAPAPTDKTPSPSPPAVTASAAATSATAAASATTAATTTTTTTQSLPSSSKAAPLPSTGQLKLSDLMSLQALLSTAEVEKTMGFTNKSANGQPVYDYTNIMHFWMQQFASKSLSAYLGDQPVFVFDIDLHYQQLGNRLGNFFEAISFAQLHGLHFVAFSPHSRQMAAAATAVAMAKAAVHPSMSSDPVSYLSFDGHPFVKNLPTLYLHPNPVQSRSEVAAMLRSTAGARHFDPWPWQSRNASWLYTIPFISHSMRRAIDATILETYKSMTPAIMASTFHHPTEHHHNRRHSAALAVAEARLSLIPDVAILFRCADVVLHGGTQYGFLNFNVYPALIPAQPKEIYILGEPLKYGQWGDTCLNVTRGLVEFLSPRFPNTTILVRRGFAFDGFAMLSLAKTVICAPSTFCFWSGLANPNTFHYANSDLINFAFAPPLTPSFHWIKSPGHFLMGFWKQSSYDLKDANSTRYILDRLESNEPPIAPDKGYIYR